MIWYNLFDTVLGKLINQDGSSELIFVGIAEQKERFAEGLTLAVMDALKSAVGDPKLILKKVSSLCTDGTNVNTGDAKSLWALMDKEVKAAGSVIPLVKIWCAAHRAELAWKNTANIVPETTNILSILSSVSSYFNYSALRTSELKKIASDNNLRLLAIPKVFEIRWSQFTFNMVRSVIVSWKALVLYFEANKDCAQCAGYLNFFTNLNNLKLLAFLGDVLFSFKFFQKKLQSNNLTLIEMKSHVATVMETLKKMENRPLPGGFENKLSAKLTIDEEDDKTYFKDIELKESSRTRRKPKDSAEVRKDVLVSLQTFLTERFKIDDELFEIIDPFVKFEESADIEKMPKVLWHQTWK